MPRMQVKCPQCRQPITADVQQIFDVAQDPSAKQRILSGAFNIAQCPHCGFQGNLSTPLLYHDSEKELLLTYVPPEMGLPRDEQERLMGSLINQVMSRLTPEQRKGYLLRPQTMLTLQGLVERVLEGEGITKEMIDAQQKRINLIQRLLGTSEDVREEIVRQEHSLLDAEFFQILSRLVEAAAMSGDQTSAEKLVELQEAILPNTEFGRQIQEQSREIEAAVNDLNKIGRELNREKLLNVVLNAPNDARLGAYVSLVRPMMDYEFFRLLSERIDAAEAEKRPELNELREKLLEMTATIDRQMQARAQRSREIIEAILESDNVGEAMAQSLPAVDEFFLQELQRIENEASEQGDRERLERIQDMVEVLQQASAAPPEVQLIEELLEAENDEVRRQILNDHSDEITPEFLSTLASITAQVSGGEDKETEERLKRLNRMALRFSMERNLGS